jgi:nicotinic acid phosphoribosyltransferase
MDNIELPYLADHADQVVALAAALHAQDYEYYGARTPADVAADLALALQREALPLALIALRDGIVLGTATFELRLDHDAPALGTLAHRVLCAPGASGPRKVVLAIEAAARGLASRSFTRS